MFSMLLAEAGGGVGELSESGCMCQLPNAKVQQI